MSNAELFSGAPRVDYVDATQGLVWFTHQGLH